MLKRTVGLMLTLASVAAHADDAPATFSLNTNGFLDKGVMPVLYTCDSRNVSPEFTITTPPAKTNTYALIETDEDAPSKPFYHWVLFNIPGKTTELKQGPDAPPAGSVIGMNSFNKSGYSGPCPPKGTTHNYTFTLYALDSKLTLPANSTGDALLAAMKGHIIKQTAFGGVYSRWLT